MKSALRWAEECFGGVDLGDVRRTERFVGIMAAAASRPGGRVSDVFRGAAQRQGAYDFVEHESVWPSPGFVDTPNGATMRQE
jgi:hypothetical protein